MSEITVSRPEVVNENTDVICSTQSGPCHWNMIIFRKSGSEHSDTFEQLHQNKEMKCLSGGDQRLQGCWNYKTNSPCKFGSKIIVNNLVRWDQWGFHIIMECRQIGLTERMLHLLSGKPIPDNRGNITMSG